MKYEPSLKSQFLDALRGAFPNRGEVDLVAGRAGLKPQWVNIFATAPSLANALQDFIDWAEANKRLISFLEAAVDQNKENDQLNRVASQLQRLKEPLNEVDADLGTLERVCFKGVNFEDVPRWIDKLGRIRRAICRVEPQPQSVAGYGTGFLIAPDIVITAWHVAKDFWNQDELARLVVLRFGYENDARGQPARGDEYKLTRDWSLPHSEVDDCDFALLRLERPAAQENVGDQQRGFLEFQGMTNQQIEELSESPPC